MSSVKGVDKFGIAFMQHIEDGSHDPVTHSLAVAQDVATARRARLFDILHQQDISRRAKFNPVTAEPAPAAILSPATLIASFAAQP